MLKNLAASAALVVFAGIVCAGDGVAFTSPDGKFKAQFPAQPKETEQSSAGGRHEDVHRDAGKHDFAITAVSLPSNT